jgi:methyl-accepting chemotaxis protein
MKNRRFQYVLTWKIMLYLLTGLIASDVLFYLLASRPLGNSYEYAVYALKYTRDTAFGRALGVDFLLLLPVLALVLFAALLMSHRISGPVYRLLSSAESIARGDFSLRVSLREKDEMKEVAAGMDEAVKVFRDKLSEMKETAGSMSEEAARLREAAISESTVDEEVGKLVDRLTSDTARLKQRLGFFKV